MPSAPSRIRGAAFGRRRRTRPLVGLIARAVLGTITGILFWCPARTCRVQRLSEEPAAAVEDF